MSKSLTPARAARHEALTVRIEALVKQLEPVARSKPGQEVSAPVRSLAEDLLFEAREFRARGERRGLVAAAPDYAGLFIQLGQALGMLARWRSRNPAPGAAGADPDGYTDAEVAEMRLNIARRLDQLVRERMHREFLPSNQAVDHSYPRARAAK
ncbi:MAG TPA: hypothetical protein VIN06_08740 [Devosia sp.]